jgi:hypothetical protein
LERLEDRLAPSVFVVTNTLDDGSAGSLRWAINQVNADPGTSIDTIDFNLPFYETNHVYYGEDSTSNHVSTGYIVPVPEGITSDADLSNAAIVGDYTIDPDWPHSWWTIQPTSALPAITHPVIIDGYSQPGASANTHAVTDADPSDNAVLRIEIDGSVASGNTLNNVDGLQIVGANSTVAGLAINRFLGYRDRDSGVLVAGRALLLEGGAGQVAGNFVGTDISGTLAVDPAPFMNDSDELSGVGTGIAFLSNNNLLGGTTAAARNLISGQSAQNVAGDAYTGNAIEGNFIGTSAAGTAALPNAGGPTSFGVNVGSGYTIGGTASGAGNVISGNDVGVQVGAGAVIQGNRIGTSAAGTAAVPNQRFGVLAGASVVIGGSAAGAGNLIAGNHGVGVNLYGVNGGPILLAGNTIGLDINGNPLGNSSNGLTIASSSAGCTIGGTVAGAGNVIAANGGEGIFLVDVQGALIAGNLIGTNPAGDAARGNTGNGIDIYDYYGTGSSGNTISGNVIGGNGVNGILLQATSGQRTGNRIQGNYIGIVRSGSPLGNSGDGLLLTDPNTFGNTIGGTGASEGNIIAFNHGDGVLIGRDTSYPANAGVDNAVLGNAIYGNGRLGIKLGFDNTAAPPQPTPAGSEGPGPNRLQNYPVITAARAIPTGTTVSGTLTSANPGPFTLEFFANGTADPSGNGQGRTLLGRDTLAASGSFSFADLPAVPSGQSIITATATDANGDTSEFSQAVQAAVTVDTTTSLSSSANPSTYGQDLVLTAQVQAPAATGQPTGSVDFFDDGILLGSAVLVGGTATWHVTLGVGTHPLTAVYHGTGYFKTSYSDVLHQEIDPIATSTTLTSNLNPAYDRQGFAYTVTVTPADNRFGPATGTVTLIDGTTESTLGTFALDGGKVFISDGAPAIGDHLLVAEFNGQGIFAHSVSDRYRQTILPQPATAFEVDAPATVTAGDPFTVTLIALDLTGLPTTGYQGTVQLTLGLADAYTSIPDHYAFTADDHGRHQFTNVMLGKAGNQTIHVMDADHASIHGDAAVTVNPGAANSLALSAPIGSRPGQTVQLTVTALDAYGNTATGFTGTVRFVSTDTTGRLPDPYTFTTADQGHHDFTARFNSSGRQTLTVKPSDGTTAAESKDEVQVDLPDLQVSGDHYAPGSYVQGAPFPYEVTVGNAGPGHVLEPFQVQVRLSKRKIWGDPDNVIVATYTEDRTVLATNTVTHDDTGAVPLGADTGLYYVGVRVDSGDTLPEGNEDNNIVWSAQQDVEVRLRVAPQIEVRGGRPAQTIAADSEKTGKTNGTDLGPVHVGQHGSAQTFEIHNLGNGPLNLLNQPGNPAVVAAKGDVGDFGITQPHSLAVAPFGFATFQVTFTPTAAGVRRAILEVNSDSPDQPRYFFTVSGTGTVSKVEVRHGLIVVQSGDTPSDAAGTLLGGANLRAILPGPTLQLRDTGTGTLNIASVQIVGDAAGDFSVRLRDHLGHVVTQPSVAPGSSVDLQVIFSPSAVGTRSATVVIASDDPASPFRFDVAGTGLAPQITLHWTGRTDDDPAGVIHNGDRTGSTLNGTDFGATDVNTGKVQETFRIINTGTDTLNLQPGTHAQSQQYVFLAGANPNDFRIVRPPTISTLAPNYYADFVVEFDPFRAEYRQADILIHSDDPQRPAFDFVIAGTGTGTPAPVMVVYGARPSVPTFTLSTPIANGDNTPSADDQTMFEPTEKDSTSLVHNFEIANTGAAPLLLGHKHVPGVGDIVIKAVTIDGTNAGDFAVTLQPADTVPAGGGSFFTMTFKPKQAGTRRARVVIMSDDPTANPFIFYVQGEGTIPATSVSGRSLGGGGGGGGGDQPLRNGESSPSDADGTDFGTADVHEPNIDNLPTRTYTITNNTMALLVLGRNAVVLDGDQPGDFSVITQPAPAVAYGFTTHFTIRFKPTAHGLRSAWVNVTSPDHNVDTFRFKIQGTGLEAVLQLLGNGQLIPDGDRTVTTADGTDFQSVDVNTGSMTRQFTIHNNGDAPMQFTTGATAFTSGDMNDFAFLNRPPPSIAPGDSASFDVKFLPTASGLRKAVIGVTSNNVGRNGPYTFAIQGTATGVPRPFIAVQWNNGPTVTNDLKQPTPPSTLDGTDFGTLSVDHSSMDETFTIVNSGPAVLNLTPITVQGPQAAAFHVTQPSSMQVPGRRANDAFVNRRNFKVTFSPTAAGVYNARIVLHSNDPDQPSYAIDLRGSRSQPVMHVLDGSQAISANGTVTVDPAQAKAGSSSHTFTISNTGDGDLSITRIVSANPGEFTAQNVPTTVAPGGQAAFQVTFTPRDAGTRSALITITSNDPAQASFTFTVQGTGRSPHIQVFDGSTEVGTSGGAPDDFHDADVNLAAAVLRTFTIRNTGDMALGLTGGPPVTVQGDAAFQVTAAPPVGTSIAPGDQATFQVTFAPTTTGNKTATLVIENTDALRGTRSIAVQGNGSGPGRPALLIDEVAPQGTDSFGDVAVGDTATHTYTIRNTGTGPLAFGSPAIRVTGAEFTWVNPPALPAQLDPGATATFQLRFRPASGGDGKSAQVEILSNDATRPDYQFQVTGNGSVPQFELHSGTLTVTTYDFGGVDLNGAVTSRTFTIHNAGRAPLRLTGAAQVTGNSDFSVTGLSAATVNAGAEQSFQIAFDPAAPGQRSATIRIASNDPVASHAALAVQGTGLAPQIALEGNYHAIANGDTTPTRADYTDYGFADVDTGVVEHRYIVWNHGQGTLHVNRVDLDQSGSDFQVSQPVQSTTVAAGNSTFFDVRFDPRSFDPSNATRSATVHVRSDDPSLPVYNFAIKGIVGRYPQIEVLGGNSAIAIGNHDTDPEPGGPTDFGTVHVGVKATIDFTIRNLGSQTLTLSGTPLVQITSNTPDFELKIAPQSSVPGVSTQLPDGGSTRFQIQFTPHDTGLRRATVTLQCNDPNNGVFTFDIIGTGV